MRLAMELLWSYKDNADSLHEEIANAVDEYIFEQNIDDSGLDAGATVVLYAYVRMESEAASCILRSRPLEYVLEAVGEEYGNPDTLEFCLEETEAMVDAEKAFLRVILNEYVPWACKRLPEGDKVVNIADALNGRVDAEGGNV